MAEAELSRSGGRRRAGKGRLRPGRALEATRRQSNVTPSTVGSPLGGFKQNHWQNLILHISNGPLTALFICVENNPYGGGQRGRGKTVAVRSGCGFNGVGVMEVGTVNSVHIL